MTSGFESPVGGSNGVPGAGVSPPLPSESRTFTSPAGPGDPHRSPQSGAATSLRPSLLKSATTISLGNVSDVGALIAALNATSAPAGAASTATSAAVARTTGQRRTVMPPSSGHRGVP